MPHRRPGAVVLVLLLGSCGDGGTGVITPSELRIVGSATRAGPVGEPVAALVVEVVDDGGDPITGLHVAFGTDDGSISPSGAVTDGQGRASSVWTLGVTAGDQEATASVGVLRATFRATAEPGSADTIEVTAPKHHLGWSRAMQLAADVVDEYGNAVSGVPLEWSSSEAGIASVSDSGRVTGVGLGPVTVAVTSGALTSTVGLRITPLADAALSTNEAGGCLLDLEGAAHCWGSNESGQLGDGTTAERMAPVSVIGGRRFVLLAAGHGSHNCGLTSSGEAYCWGSNVAGQLGDGTTLDRGSPVPVSGGHVFRAIAVGTSHTCALEADGRVLCWGDNAVGQVGDGGGPGARLAPTPVAAGAVFEDVTAGGGTSCALAAGQAYCWGADEVGQVGDGATGESRVSPVAVVGGHEFLSVEAGQDHVCGVTTGGQAYCWGANAHGQLGNGSYVSSSVPVQVNGLSAVARITAGTYTTCAIAGEDAYCWGFNQYGLMADGLTWSRASPWRIDIGVSWSQVRPGVRTACGSAVDGTPYCWGLITYTGRGLRPAHSAPALVEGGHSFVTITAGFMTTCAAGPSGGYCWGENLSKELGLGDYQYRVTPSLITTVDLTEIDQGWGHACGLGTDGTGYCWGGGGDGKLGHGGIDSRGVPTQVAADFAFSDIEVGFNHTCGIRASDGAAYCWGDNAMGQIGDGSADDALLPTAVAGGHVFTDLAGGEFHTCGLTTVGAVLCWGSNLSGQLGDGSTTDRATPVPVSGSIDFAGVTSFGRHTCGWTAGGQAYCWGYNSSYQLGDGTHTYRTTPVLVAGSAVYSALAAGLYHTCGVDEEGVVYCWGDGTDGQDGRSETRRHAVPVPIEADLVISELTAGADHTCGISVPGATYCWGNLGFGQLGNGLAAAAQPAMVQTDRMLPPQ